MYSEWVSLQTAIQSDSSHTSVLKRFPAAVSKEIIIPIVKNISQGLSINTVDQPSKLYSIDEVNWTMEVICQGLTLPFTEHDILKECVNIYCEWMSGCLIRKKMCVPKPVVEAPVTFSTKMLSHLYNLFVPREKSSVDQVNRQAMLCHRALRMLETIAKESSLLNRELWEAILKFLLATTDTLLAPPREKDGISDELSERMVSVLFEMWLLSCSTSFPVPSLWRTFRDMCANWRHHEAVITQWCRVNYALIGPLLVKLYGPDHPSIVISLADKAVVSSLTKDCVSKLNDDCLVQCWFRFLHVLSNPVDLCRVEVISETPKFLHHALASEKVIEPTQHECLQQLPAIFYKAMKGIANLMDGFLGVRQPQRNQDFSSSNNPLRSSKASTSSSAPVSTAHTPPLSRHLKSTSVVASNSNKMTSPSKQHGASSVIPSIIASMQASNQTTGGALEYASRPLPSPDRSSINSILNVLGMWLFEAAMCHTVNKRKRPGSISQRTGSIASPSSNTNLSDQLNFDSGRAEACGAIARLMCTKKAGEIIQPIYIARSYMALYDALSAPFNGSVMTLTLFHMADMFRVDLPGVNILLPKILPALECVLATGANQLYVHDRLPEVELRKACIHILLSILSLPFHYNNVDIKDLYSGEKLYTYMSLKSRLAQLILNALTFEKDSSNSNMLLGALALIVQDMATHEVREQEKLSSVTSCTSQEQYTLSTPDSLSYASSDNLTEPDIPPPPMPPPDVILRRPTSRITDDCSSAAGVLLTATKQICSALISDWWTDYSLAIGALELLASFARVKLLIVNIAMCKETVSQICKFIGFLCSRPPQNQTRNLHSMILAALHCLSQWLLEHTLLQDKECLYTVLEVVELGISGKRSRQPNSQEVLMKGAKEHLPMSLKVKDAAEALLMCITDQVDSFPSPCGPESLYSTLSEKDLSEDFSNFKYFSLNNLTILAVLEQNKKSLQSAQELNTVKVVIRGPFGRQIWIVEPKSEQTGSSKPVKAARPKPAAPAAARPRIEQRWWPSSVDSIPLVKADKTLPRLDDLDDLDPKFASIINAKIESELKNGPSLAHSAPPAPSECEPPSPRNHSQSARVLLSQLGLLSSQSLQECQGMPPYLCRLDSGDAAFIESLKDLDQIANRTRDTVYVFYVKAGQNKVSDILDNTKSYKSLNSDFKDLLLSMGWPVNIHTHPGWTGATKSGAKASPYPSQEPDQIPSSRGPAAFDGTRWLLYWSDSRTEVAFIVPTEERNTYLSKLNQSQGNKTVTAAQASPETASSDRKSSGSGKESSRGYKGLQEVRTLVVWCERVEDQETVPLDDLLTSTNGPSDSGTPAEYMIVYVTALSSGLVRVHVTTHTERCGTPLPLVDGMVCLKRTLGVLIRQTAVNMAARKRLLNELSLIPHNRRVQKMQDIINKYRYECTESEFYEALFTT